MGIYSRRLRGVRLQLLDFEADAKQIEKLAILAGDKCGKKKWLSMLSTLRRESSEDQRVIVTFEKNARTRTIAGFLWFSLNSSREAIIRDTWVSPRRRREGLASDMVLHLVVFLVGSPSLGVPRRRRSSSGSVAGGGLPNAGGGGFLDRPEQLHLEKLLAYPLQGSSTFWASLGFVRDPGLPGCLKLERDDLHHHQVLMRSHRSTSTTTPNTSMTASTTASPPSSPGTPIRSKGRKRSSARLSSSKRKQQALSESSASRAEDVGIAEEVLESVRLRSVLHARVLSWSEDSDALQSLRLGSNDGLRKWTRMLTMMRRDSGSFCDPHHRVVVIFDASNASMTRDVRVSGFMWFSNNSPSEIMIRDTWVDPSRRRLGIGSRMVRIFATSMVSSMTGDHSSNSSAGSSSSSASTQASSSGGDDYSESSAIPAYFDTKAFRVLALPAPGSTTFWESNLFSGDGQSGGFLQLTWDAMVRLAQPGMDAEPETPRRKCAKTSPPSTAAIAESWRSSAASVA
ncbi:hypothetical protein FOL47_007297 [Perkinsus chesapeaki]|uniref:Uncharacterized protein n=1 Tax=Perkinsus chesapeaki TaxID=330153 RepID=A0A7J6LLD6_PERCH|nr:hypothetical protein FOL47_007297 [Perkinsus chesapeaki]